MKFIPARCPSCGAGLSIPEGLDKAHCVYCGSLVLVRESSSNGRECKVCQGYGRIDVCKACDGSGKCSWYDVSSAHVRGDVYVWAKYGVEARCDEGRCSACGGLPSGDAFSPCPFCGGTGRCPRCLGTAKCPACRGVGVIPGPSGSDKCPGCGGTGQLEGAPPKPQELSACPECGRLMTAEECFCGNCGFVNACPRCGSGWAEGSLICPWCGYKKGGKV